jgi:hypothetical protein
MRPTMNMSGMQPATQFCPQKWLVIQIVGIVWGMCILNYISNCVEIIWNCLIKNMIFSFRKRSQVLLNDKQSPFQLWRPTYFSCYKHSGPVINIENYVVLSFRNVYMCVYWNATTLKCWFNKCFNLFIYLTMITYRQRVHISDDHSFDKTPNTYY